jgi:uncharacterized membrane protein
MTWIDRLSLFSTYDFIALGCLMLAWFFMEYIIENAPKNRPSTTQIMVKYRRDWMVFMAERDNRIFDSQIMNGLRQGTSFFASATMISIGGLVAMLGNADRFAGIANELTLAKDPHLVWEIKLFVVLFFVTNAFLKFVWSHRLFGYCTIIIAAVPNDQQNPLADHRAYQAGEINITAARSYNRGLRSVYFAICALSWLAGDWALMLGTVITVAVLWRREFLSASRTVLLNQPQ